MKPVKVIFSCLGKQKKIVLCQVHHETYVVYDINTKLQGLGYGPFIFGTHVLMHGELICIAICMAVCQSIRLSALPRKIDLLTIKC